MYWIAAILIIVVLPFIFMKKKKKQLIKENIPSRLGYLQHKTPYLTLLEKLDEALSAEYIEKVKRRFLEERPKVTEDEFEWRFFELKRYFILCSLLKETPMYSREVDEVWHEMILFTKEYESFSNSFFGYMLHHIPNTSQENNPNKRALFDWLFSQLFEIKEYTWNAWGSFFASPFDRMFLNECKQNPTLFKQKYFNITPVNEPIVEQIIKTLTLQLQEAEKMYSQNPKGEFNRVKTFGDLSSLSYVMVFYSYYYFEDYWEMAKKYIFVKTAHHTSGCSAVFCGSGYSADKDSDSSGDSSCSSCGGGD